MTRIAHPLQRRRRRELAARFALKSPLPRARERARVRGIRRGLRRPDSKPRKEESMTHIVIIGAGNVARGSLCPPRKGLRRRDHADRRRTAIFPMSGRRFPRMGSRKPPRRNSSREPRATRKRGLRS